MRMTVPPSAAAALVDDVARSRKQDVATMLAGADRTWTMTRQTIRLTVCRRQRSSAAQMLPRSPVPRRITRIGSPPISGTLMEHALAVRCDARSISEALNLLDTVIRPRANRLTAHSETPAFNQEITAIWEVRHLTLLAEAMLRASEARHGIARFPAKARLSDA